MTWVKVCGLRTDQDVAVAVAAGADAVGFVNVSESPRFVSVAQAADLAEGLAIEAVLLTRATEPEVIAETLATLSS